MKKLLLVIILIFPIILLGQEICNNGIDDDGDGLIDLFDDECECEGFSSTQSVPSLIPNYSFESNSCCPSGYSQLNCADTWQQACEVPLFPDWLGPREHPRTLLGQRL